MDKKINFTFMDYMCIGLVVLFIIGNIYVNGQNRDKAQQAKIEAAYSEGYSQGYYDCENGLPYDEDR